MYPVHKFFNVNTGNAIKFLDVGGAEGDWDSAGETQNYFCGLMWTNFKCEYCKYNKIFYAVKGVKVI